MAMTKTIVKTTPHSILYLLEEAGTTAAELAIAVATDCAAGPLKTLLQTAVADQAAARTLIEDNCTISVFQRAGSTGDSVHMALDFDDNSTVFEMNAIAVKGADGDTGDFYVKIKFDHSLTA